MERDYLSNPHVLDKCAQVTPACTEAEVQELVTCILWTVFPAVLGFNTSERYRKEGKEPDNRVVRLVQGTNKEDLLLVENKRPKEKPDLPYFDKVAKGQLKGYVKQSRNAAGTVLHNAVVTGLYIKFYWTSLPEDGPRSDDTKPLHFVDDASRVQAWFDKIRNLTASQIYSATPPPPQSPAYAIRSVIPGPSTHAGTAANSPPLEAAPDAVKVKVEYNGKNGTYKFAYNSKAYTKTLDQFSIGIVVENTKSTVCCIYSGQTTGLHFWFYSPDKHHSASHASDIRYEDHEDSSATYCFTHNHIEYKAHESQWVKALQIENGYTYDCHYYSRDGKRLFWTDTQI